MTYVRPDGLPQFRRPPVVEVRMEMVFAPLSIKVTQLPALFELWGDRYPNLDERAPQPVIIDRATDGTAGLRIDIVGSPRIPQVRFSDDVNSRWVELQADMMTCGWSRSSESEYPRYEDLRAQFEKLALEFSDFVSSDLIQIVQLSLTYVNEFDLPGSSTNPLAALGSAYRLGESLTHFTDGTSVLSRAGLDLSFSFDHEGVNYAVLNSQSEATPTQSGAAASRMRLRFSGDPFSSPDADEQDHFSSMLSLFDRGHIAIVETFAQATSPTLHTLWERY